MVATSNRLNHQPQRYDQLCACLLGPFASFAPFVNDPSIPRGCLGSAVSNPIPSEPCCHQMKYPQMIKDHSYITL
jgi:hypothetical protein